MNLLDEANVHCSDVTAELKIIPVTREYLYFKI